MVLALKEAALTTEIQGTLLNGKGAIELELANTVMWDIRITTANPLYEALGPQARELKEDSVPDLRRYSVDRRKGRHSGKLR